VLGTLILATTTSGATAPKGSSAFTFLILAVLGVGFYLLILRPQRNRQRRTMQTQSQVMPGQRIRTTTGMYGTVVSGDDRDVVIEVAPGVQVTMLRRAIMDVVPEDMAPDADGVHDDGVHDAAEEYDHEPEAETPEAEPETEPEAGHEDVRQAGDADVRDRKS
jgi:preprotein translocase subunit YajC